MDYSIEEICILLALFVGLLSMMWFVIVALMEERVPIIHPGDYLFDYVVVGAGTCGSVVASILAKHSNATILLVEAGDKFGILSKIPLLTTFQQKGINDWGFLSTSQLHSSKGLEDARQCLPRGKGLGGSSQLNYMLHFDGHEGDFERWSRELNLTNWNWSSVKPFLKAGAARPFERMDITPDYSLLAKAFNEASVEFLHKPWHFRTAQYNVKNGLRHSVYQRFLQSAYKQKNLRIMLNTYAKSIEFALDENPNKNVYAKSLWLSTKDEKSGKEYSFEVRIGRELVVSAGAYQTPQLLMVSGLGKRNELKQIIGNVSAFLPDVPMVGQHLHDHINLPLYISIDAVGPTLNQRSLLNPMSILNYLTTGGGHMGNFGVLGHIGHFGRNLSDTYGLTFFGAGSIDESVLMSISNFKKSHFRALFPRYYNSSQEGFVMISTCLQPLSRGNVKIQSSNIKKHPLIDPKYMAEKADVECTLKAIRAGIEVVTSEAFSSLGVQIHWPRIKECIGSVEHNIRNNNPSNEYLECLIRYVGLGSHHPGGTCKMGTNVENSVVNEEFKIHGIDKIRIIDASVLPTPLSGNPNSILVGMAMRGAAMILKDHIYNDD
ncbi:neither inactivation nor afterpotential protein G [Musca vetustissima]|uniref:neither inactivation nor afterpotential protein G n=1 Tax=Musca vetustissima TaxID=27455 RepID=UPI002AB79BDE|nr:neither inactivation nor afterpotential protein G [Musca vetustissima]